MANEDPGQPRRTILSIDGGGIRGVIPAIVLSEIEERTQKSTAELFDVIAGTSTGGILALGLTCPGEDGRARFTAEDLAGMYRQEGATIFPHELWGRFRELFGPKYPARGRHKVLAGRFGSTMLSEAMTEVIVTSYDVRGRSPVFFRRAGALAQPDTHDFPMSDVAMATSAAPTYFPPVRLLGGTSQEMVLVDGGVFANNPGMCGFVDESSVGARREGTLMVSLGTGELTKPLSYRQTKRWGVIGWGLHVLDLVFDGVTETVEYQLQRTLGSGFRRFQCTLAESEQAMDDASEENLLALEASARRMLREHEADIENLCRELVSIAR